MPAVSVLTEGGIGSVGRLTLLGNGRVFGRGLGFMVISLLSLELSVQSLNSMLTSWTGALAALAALLAAVTAATVSPAACSTFS